MPKQQLQLSLSPTVKRTQRQLSDQESVYAVDIVRLLLEFHPEYGGNTSSLSLIAGDNSEREPFDIWLEEVRTLFRADLKSKLHGRLLIVGLSLLDQDLRRQLDDFEFLTALYEEFDEPVENLLSDIGRDKWNISDSDISSQPDVENEGDSVSAYTDDAVQNIDEDQLGRAVYARYLAKRLVSISNENISKEHKEGPGDNSQLAFAMHLYSPWGSGKSTLLNFLENELNKDWLVVNFNAWRNQHIEPPWWALMECVFRQSKKNDLSFWNRIREHWWRLRHGQAHHFFYLFLSACLFGIGSLFFGDFIFEKIDDENDVAQSVSVVLSVIVGAWAAIQGISHSLLQGSKKAAEAYLETSSNIMDIISSRFATLIKRIEDRGNSKRVVIFIDDLDRCQSKYVVDLLEGFQTLFRIKSVFFVVAADQQWLNACFDEVYSKLRPHVQQPGKSLGILFLEKVFQLSAPVPGIPPPLKEAYWHHLLKMKKQTAEEDAESAHKKAQTIMSEIGTDADIAKQFEQNKQLSFTAQRAMREEAIVRLATPDLTKDIEKHTLAPFVKLLEPNPRSMKRLINAYSINRALSFNGHLDITKEKIVLWTILAMRWPELASHLEEVPEDFERIGQERSAGDDSSISILLEDKDKKIRDVVHGKGLSESLDEETIKLCAMLKA